MRNKHDFRVCIMTPWRERELFSDGDLNVSLPSVMHAHWTIKENQNLTRYFRNLLHNQQCFILPVYFANYMDSFDWVLYELRGVPLTWIFSVYLISFICIFLTTSKSNYIKKICLKLSGLISLLLSQVIELRFMHRNHTCMTALKFWLDALTY